MKIVVLLDQITVAYNYNGINKYTWIKLTEKSNQLLTQHN